MALALTSRRSTVAAVASALAAMAIAAAVAGRGCRVSQRGPEVAVHEMLQAARTGDLDRVLGLLSPRTRARLEAEARRATDLVGAAERFTTKALVSMGSSDSAAAPTDITVLDELDDRAVVELVSPAGRARLELVRIDGRWLIDVPAYGRGEGPGAL
ncbi:MAG TPA: hypothetical protein VNO30_31280 [Kofleriaceae bacterium]|nr:hypothetical protein [Kofleriaceae bacterium]